MLRLLLPVFFCAGSTNAAAQVIKAPLPPRLDVNPRNSKMFIF